MTNMSFSGGLAEPPKIADSKNDTNNDSKSSKIDEDMFSLFKELVEMSDEDFGKYHMNVNNMISTLGDQLEDDNSKSMFNAVFATCNYINISPEIQEDIVHTIGEFSKNNTHFVDHPIAVAKHHETGSPTPTVDKTSEFKGGAPSPRFTLPANPDKQDYVKIINMISNNMGTNVSNVQIGEWAKQLQALSREAGELPASLVREMDQQLNVQMLINDLYEDATRDLLKPSMFYTAAFQLGHNQNDYYDFGAGATFNKEQEWKHIKDDNLTAQLYACVRVQAVISSKLTMVNRQCGTEDMLNERNELVRQIQNLIIAFITWNYSLQRWSRKSSDTGTFVYINSVEDFLEKVQRYKNQFADGDTVQWADGRDMAVSDIREALNISDIPNNDKVFILEEFNKKIEFYKNSYVTAVAKKQNFVPLITRREKIGTALAQITEAGFAAFISFLVSQLIYETTTQPIRDVWVGAKIAAALSTIAGGTWVFVPTAALGTAGGILTVALPMAGLVTTVVGGVSYTFTYVLQPRRVGDTNTWMSWWLSLAKGDRMAFLITISVFMSVVVSYRAAGKKFMADKKIEIENATKKLEDNRSPENRREVTELLKARPNNAVVRQQLGETFRTMVWDPTCVAVGRGAGAFGAWLVQMRAAAYPASAPTAVPAPATPGGSGRRYKLRKTKKKSKKTKTIKRKKRRTKRKKKKRRTKRK